MINHYFLLLLIVVAAEALSLIPRPIPICDKPNEHYEECGIACQNECHLLGVPCFIKNKKCNSGCYCDEGYARNFAEDCISVLDCPPMKRCTNPNEHYDCGSACQTKCETLGDLCDIFNKKCTEDCYCNNGFARDAAGVCISVEECPPKSSSESEELHF